jgi:2-oxo-4-hydroxy-4-carboxy-5-ureidoimidazoline decarboxylase
MAVPISLSEINLLDQTAFVATLGWIFEDSPWVAQRAWASRPFPDPQSLLHAMRQQVLYASREEQLKLLLAHPDLGTRARMSDASVGEQAGAGLDRLSPEEFHRLTSANELYRNTFGFPFLFAVKGSTKDEILAALELRLAAPIEQEFATALQQVFRIAAFRLEDLIH